MKKPRKLTREERAILESELERALARWFRRCGELNYQAGQQCDLQIDYRISAVRAQ